MAKAPSPPAPPSMLRIAGTCFIGTAIEWYDFFVYGLAAALVFGPLFFPEFSSVAGTLAAFGTFAVGFVARPLGGAVMGHFGDRIGRKSMLIASLMVMGVATVLIGLLPTYAVIGGWAPVLLVALRFVQGIGVGGEWGGAVLVSVEHAPKHRRGFYGSFPQMGVPAGIIMANLVFLGLAAVLTDEQFAAWGWRVPFLFSAALVAIGLYARLKLEESPIFAQAKAKDVPARMPLVALVRDHWRRLLLASIAFMSSSMIGYIVLVYALSYGTGVLEVSRSTMLVVVLLSAVVQLVATPLLAGLSDRVGRRRVFIAGALTSALWAAPMFLMLDTRNPLVMTVALCVAVVFLSGMYGPQAAIASELFPTEVRYSGASLGYQFSSILGGGFAPMIATALFAATGTSLSAAVYIAVFCLASLLAIVFAPETHRVSLTAEVGARPATRSAEAQEVAVS